MGIYQLVQKQSQAKNISEFLIQSQSESCYLSNIFVMDRKMQLELVFALIASLTIVNTEQVKEKRGRTDEEKGKPSPTKDASKEEGIKEETKEKLEHSAEEWLRQTQALLNNVKDATVPYVEEIKMSANKLIEDSPAIWEDVKKNGKKTYDDFVTWIGNVGCPFKK